MINIRTLKKLTDGDGLTLKNGKKIKYKTGYQVATEGVECTTPEQAKSAIKEYNGNCGIWYYEGIYYIDKSQRISTRAKAIEIGSAHNQQSIYRWRDGGLIFLH